MMDRIDEFFMQEALNLAAQAAALGEAPVGCVIVRDGKIIGRGYNVRESENTALGHAELIAIEEACRSVGGWRLCGCDLYVTLEPCPMCTGACINSRIDRVIYGASDPKAGSISSVINLFELPYNHRPAVTEGVLKEECSEILSSFFSELRAKKKSRKADF